MPRRRGLISDENLHTVVTVAFLVALLSVGLNIYTILRLQRVVESTEQIYRTQVASDERLAEKVGSIDAMEHRLETCENRIQALEHEVSSLRELP